MPVKITVGQPSVYSLTSPPPKPEPTPPKDLVAKEIQYEDRTIAVTIPFPDTIELSADVVNEITANPDQSGKKLKAVYHALDKEIYLELFKVSASADQTPPPKAKKSFTITYDDAQPLNHATLTFQRRAGKEYPVWSVRLEFSASKAGPIGLAKILAGVEEIAWFINVPALFGTLRISRVDAAIDCIGATPVDLVAQVPKLGKRTVWIGDGGEPETVYFFQAKKHPKAAPKTYAYRTYGPQRLTLYERRAYQVQRALHPPYGECPATRCEVQKRWKKNRPFLHELAKIKNLFEGRRVAYAPTVVKVASPSRRKAWIRYCLGRFGGGAAKVTSKWPLAQAIQFEKLYRECDGDLVDAVCWDRWKDGLVYTGMDAWIKMAE